MLTVLIVLCVLLAAMWFSAIKPNLDKEPMPMKQYKFGPPTEPSEPVREIPQAAVSIAVEETPAPAKRVRKAPAKKAPAKKKAAPKKKTVKNRR